jgi:hypothetical protein
MINMQVDEKDAKKETIEAIENEEPKYPWGLQLNMNNDELEKLGLMDEKIKVGDEIRIEAVCKVIGVNEDETLNEGIRKNVRYQITEMEIETEEESEPQKMAKKIYKK